MKIEELKKYLDQKFIEAANERNRIQTEAANERQSLQTETANVKKYLDQKFIEAANERNRIQTEAANERQSLQADTRKIGAFLESHISDQRDFGPMIAETRREVSALSKKHDKLAEIVSLNRLAISKR